MDVYTIGFTQQTARQFFAKLQANGIRRLVDVRLNNVSQLAGFAKRDDLAYFLESVCGAEYRHEPLLAPTQEMLDQYKKHGGSWDAYERLFRDLMRDREIEKKVEPMLLAGPTVLLCSEPTAVHCHRRLVLEHLQAKWGGLTVKDL